MKTNIVMERDFFSTKISQRTKDSYFCATELLKAYNKSNSGKRKTLYEFLKLNQTKNFMTELAIDLNIKEGKKLFMEHDLIIAVRGKKGQTWMQPYLFIKFAMWLSPKFEVMVMKWVTDNLIDYRTQAGDHYKEMCSCIMDKYTSFFNKKPSPLIFSKEARFLNLLVFQSETGKNRNQATAEQLNLMNKLQVANIKLINEQLPKTERQKQLQMFAELFNA